MEMHLGMVAGVGERGTVVAIGIDFPSAESWGGAVVASGGGVVDYATSAKGANGEADYAKSAEGANGGAVARSVQCHWGARCRVARGAPRPPARRPFKFLRTETVLALTRVERRGNGMIGEGSWGKGLDFILLCRFLGLRV